MNIEMKTKFLGFRCVFFASFLLIGYANAPMLPFLGTNSSNTFALNILDENSLKYTLEFPNPEKLFHYIQKNDEHKKYEKDSIVTLGLDFIEKIKKQPASTDDFLPISTCNGIMRTALAIYIYHHNSQNALETIAVKEVVQYMARKEEANKVFLASKALFMLFSYIDLPQANKAKMFALYETHGATNMYKTLVSLSLLHLLQNFYFNKPIFNKENATFSLLLDEQYKTYAAMQSGQSIISSKKNQKVFNSILNSVIRSLSHDPTPPELITHNKALSLLSSFQAALEQRKSNEQKLNSMVEQVMHLKSMRHYNAYNTNMIIKLLEIHSVMHHTALLRASAFIKWEYEVHQNTKTVFSNKASYITGSLIALTLIMNSIYTAFSTPDSHIDPKITFIKTCIYQYSYVIIAAIGFYSYLKYKYQWY